MDRIGIRELRQHASRYVARAAAGESIEITDRGKLVAVLSPPRKVSALDRLRAAGHVHEAKGDLRDVEPVPPLPGERPLSEELADLRSDER